MPEKVALTTSAKRRLRRKKMALAAGSGKKAGPGDKTAQKGQTGKIDKTKSATDPKAKKVKKPQEAAAAPQKTAKTTTNGQTKKKPADQPMSVDADSNASAQAKAKPAKAKPAKK